MTYNFGRDPRLFLVDVEAYGASPFSGKMTEYGIVDLETKNWIRGVFWETVPNPDLPAQPLPKREKTFYTTGFSEHDLAHGFTKSTPDARGVYEATVEWLEKLCGGVARPVLTSDNNGYDASWVNYGFDSVGMDNPFGHSSRRIGDLCAGYFGSLRKQSTYKQWRRVPHTHESHWDSMGNAIALEKLLKKMNSED